MLAMAADGINLTNQFLIAMPGMADDAFAGSVVYLCEHNDKGALVQTERGFVLHDPQADDALAFSSTLKVPGGLAMTTSKDVLEALANGQGPKRVLVTLGYSGWSAGQLEDELGRNGWLTVDAAPQIIFDTPVAQRYERALGLLGIDPSMLSQEAGHA
jgi:putative transcriptional regulator